MRLLPDFKNLPFFKKEKEEVPTQVFREEEPRGSRKILPFLLLGLLTLGAVLGAGGYLWWQQKQVKPSPLVERPPEPVKILTQEPLKLRLAPDEEIAKIGEETIFGSDFNFWLEAYEGRWQNFTPEQIKTEVLKLAQEQSIILQEAAKSNLLTLVPAIFNNPNKDYPQRNKTVEEMQKKLEEERLESISLERLTIFFNNYPSRQTLPEEQRKEIAYGKLKELREEVIAGRLTMFEAGERIKQDESLKEVDVAWKGNAYAKIENQPHGENWFADARMDEAAWNLNQGEVSEILTGRSSTNDQEIYYTFLKINEKKMRGFPSFSAWFEAKKGEYEIKVL